MNIIEDSLWEEKMKKIIFSILDKREHKVFLFWSRATWDYKVNSDYDIWILWKNKLDFNKYLEIKAQLDELPYIIDFVDFNRVDDDFKKIALNKIKVWN